jgi:hypothetical protein
MMMHLYVMHNPLNLSCNLFIYFAFVHGCCCYYYYVDRLWQGWVTRLTSLMRVTSLLGDQNPVVVGGDDDGAATPQPNGPMHWTPVLFSFMLRRFHDLVGQGVKTDKGFEEVHVRRFRWKLSMVGAWPLGDMQ